MLITLSASIPVIYGSSKYVLLVFWWTVVGIIYSFLCIKTELKSVDTFTTNTDHFFIACTTQNHNLFFRIYTFIFFLISQYYNITFRTLIPMSQYRKMAQKQCTHTSLNSLKVKGNLNDT